MYTAIFDHVTTYLDAADQMKPFILFDAKRRDIEVKDDDRFAILKIDTSMSYISIPLGQGISIGAIENELKELETQLDAHARVELARLLNDQQK